MLLLYQKNKVDLNDKTRLSTFSRQDFQPKAKLLPGTECLEDQKALGLKILRFFFLSCFFDLYK